MVLIVNSFKWTSNLLRRRLTLSHGIPELYRPSINRHKDKLIELLKEKADVASQSAVARKLRELKGFYTLEVSPPTGAEEMAKVQADLKLIQDFIKTNCWKFLTIKQAWLLFLVCLEVFLWFFIGETIGKMHLVGYKV